MSTGLVHLIGSSPSAGAKDPDPARGPGFEGGSKEEIEFTSVINAQDCLCHRPKNQVHSTLYIVFPSTDIVNFRESYLIFIYAKFSLITKEM